MFNIRLLLLITIFPLLTHGMEENADPNARRDTSVIEAFMAPSFETQEVKGEVLFSCNDYRNKTVYQLPLRTAALIVYQMRRDKCNLACFRNGLINLAERLTQDADDELSDEDIKLFQGYRLHLFDSPVRELTNQKSHIMSTLRKTLDSQELSPSEKSKKMDAAYAETNARYDQMIVNRNAYNTAFCLADPELVKQHMLQEMRYRPIFPLTEAIKELRAKCRKHEKPFQLTEL